MKFCCTEFKGDWELRRETGINIRIIKYSAKELDILKFPHKYRFIMTVGYNKDEMNVPKKFINYCPYCGMKLEGFYNSDSYINETNKSFMKFG